MRRKAKTKRPARGRGASPLTLTIGGATHWIPAIFTAVSPDGYGLGMCTLGGLGDRGSDRGEGHGIQGGKIFLEVPPGWVAGSWGWV